MKAWAIFDTDGGRLLIGRPLASRIYPTYAQAVQQRAYEFREDVIDYYPIREIEITWWEGK